MAEGQRASGGASANPQNAKRAYERPVTRNIVSPRTMSQGVAGVLGRNTTESAINTRELNLLTNNLRETDTGTSTVEQATRYWRNYDRIRKAADNMRRKTNTRAYQPTNR